MPRRKPEGPKLQVLKISLEGLPVPVWRRVTLSEERTLGDLHRLIQVLMDWDDDHAHLFETRDGELFSSSDVDFGDDNEEICEEEEFLLADALRKPKAKLLYTYDLSDEWQVEVRHERGVFGKPELELLGGAGAFPFDVGGYSSYAACLDAMEAGEVEEYEDYLPRGFDPSAFPRKKLLAGLKKLSTRMAKSAKKRAKRPGQHESARPLRATLLEISQHASDLPSGQALAALSLNHQEFGRSLMSLAVYDPSAEVSSCAVGMLVAAAKDPGVPRELGQAVLRDAAPLAREALASHDVLPERRQVCLVVLELAGELDPETAEKAMQELGPSLAASIRRMAQELEDGPHGVESLLESLGLLDHVNGVEPDAKALEQGLGFAAAVAEANPRAGATLLGAIVAIGREHDLPLELLRTGVERIEGLDPDRAAWVLRELGSWPCMGLVGEMARAGAERLSAEGAQPRAMPSGALAQARVSQVDGAGCRSVALAFHRGDGASDGVFFLLDDHLGIKDAFDVEEGGAVLDQFAHHNPEMVTAPCGIELARSLVADALAVHQATGRPVPGRFLLLRHWLGAEPLVPQRRVPDLSTYLLETFVRAPELVRGSDSLIEDTVFGPIGFDKDELYELLRDAPRPRGKKKKQLAPALFEAFLARAEEVERARVIERLAANLELMALAGQGKTPAARAAVGVYLALTESLVGWSEIPLIRAMAEDSIPRIVENIARGYTSQARANAAYLAQEQLGLRA